MRDAEARRTMFLTALAYKRMAEHLEHAADHLSTQQTTCRCPTQLGRGFPRERSLVVSL
jgi:hypothetical protein